jgi:hypothetical protein
VSEPAGHALALARWVLDHQLDRRDTLGRTIRSPAAPTNKLVQLIAKIVGDGFLEAHVHDAPLVLGQAESFVKADRHMHTAADQPASPISPAETTRPPLAAPDAVRRCRTSRRQAA